MNDEPKPNAVPTTGDLLGTGRAQPPKLIPSSSALPGERDRDARPIVFTHPSDDE